ncbi:hypothetical protein GKKCFE_06245 [Pseudomonas sp. E141]|uniref:hypothetical protein n=1 Tax=Pseudomonas sp. E141 TaxID=2875961 RepID=UPI004045EEB9
MATLVAFFSASTSMPTSRYRLMISFGHKQLYPSLLEKYSVSQQSKEEANGSDKWNEWRGYTGREQ